MINETELPLLADKLKPYIVPWLPKPSSPGGSRGGSLVAHDIGGPYHSGTLRNDQAPQFSLLDGSRVFTGNIAFVGAQTVDGVDLSAHVANANAHHAQATIGANSGLTLTGQLFNMGTPGGLSATSTSAVSGASHTHAITASSDVSAGTSALLKSAAGGLTLATLTTTGVISGAINTDTAHKLGYATVGYVGYSGYAGFAANAFAITGNYALLQHSSNGNVLLNAPTGQTIAHRINNTSVYTMDVNGIEMQASSRIQTNNYASQTTGWRVGYAGDADYRYIFTDELHAKSFIADLEQALAGGQIICKSVATLAVAFTAPAASGTATLRVNDLPSAANMAVFQSGDIVRLRQFSRASGSLSIADCWGVVTSYADQTDGTQTWTFTRSAAPNAGAMATSTVVNAESIVLDYGTTGNGFYEVNAIDGVYGVNSPYAQVATWTTHPATGTTVRGRYGKLSGLSIGVANEFGIAVGSGFTTTDQYFKASNVGVTQNNVDSVWRASGVTYLSIDSTNGINMEYGTGVQRRISWLSGSSELGSIGSYDLGGGSNQRALRLYSTSDASTKSASVDFTASSYSGANYASLSIDAKSDSAGGLSENRVYLAADNIVNTLGNGVFKIRYGVTDTFIFNPNTTYPYFYFKATSEKGIYLSSNYRDYATSDSGSAEIANDPATYDSLVIAGNNKSTFRRRVQIFDQLTINGNYPTVFDNQNQLQIRNGNASIGLAASGWGYGGAILWNAGLAAQTSTMFNAGQTKYMGNTLSPTSTAAGMLYYDANANYFTFQMGNVGLAEGNSINWSQKLLIDKYANILIGGATSGSGQGVIGIKTATASPATTAGQGFLWVTAAGALMYKSPAGTITAVAPA